MFGILLWHHFQYYKRHKTKLVCSFILPILLLGVPFGITTWLTNMMKNNDDFYEKLHPRNFQARSFFSSSPLELLFDKSCNPDIPSSRNFDKQDHCQTLENEAYLWFEHRFNCFLIIVFFKFNIQNVVFNRHYWMTSY